MILLSFQKISSKVEAKIAEIAKERNMSQDLTKEITSRVLEILEREGNQIEEKKTKLEEYIDCLEIYFDYCEKINDARRSRCLKLLKEKNELQTRISILEEQKSKSDLL